MNEKELIAKIAAGDTTAFRELFENHKRKVFSTCLSYLQNKESAEDLMQEVFVEVFRSVNSFKENSSVSTWIYKITVNKCLDDIKFHKRKKRFSFFISLFDNETGEPMHEPSDFIHPVITMENKELSKYLFSAIDLLPENQKTAFILYNMESVKQTEIAEIMNLSVKGVESLLQRAKANLRKTLGDYYEKNF